MPQPHRRCWRDRLSQVRCLALDYTGTLAGAAPPLTGELVAAVIGRWPGAAPVPEGFADTFSQHQATALDRDRAGRRQTSLGSLLMRAARQHGYRLPAAPSAIVAQILDAWPDGALLPGVSGALRALHGAGYRMILACDTRRTPDARRRSLVAAGVDGYFHGMVLSSAVGRRKPHPAFYREVLRLAGYPAGQVLFAGDTPGKDVDAPRRLGMQSVLVSAMPSGPLSDHDDPAVIVRLAELPILLKGYRRGQ